MCRASSGMIMVDVDKRCSAGILSLNMLRYKIDKVFIPS